MRSFLGRTFFIFLIFLLFFSIFVKNLKNILQKVAKYGIIFLQLNSIFVFKRNDAFVIKNCFLKFRQNGELHDKRKFILGILSECT